MSYNDHQRLLCEELCALRPLKEKVGKLEAELKASMVINDRARLFENRVVSLTEEVSLKEQEIESLRSQMKDYAITKSHSDHELQKSIERLKEENTQLKLGQDDPDGSEALAKQTSSSAKLAQEVISLQRLLKQRENELQVLKARVAMDGEDSPVKNPSRIIPKALATSSRSKSADAVLEDQTDPQLVGKDSLQPLAVPGRAVTDGGGTELASLLQELTEKDAKVAKLTQQLQKLEETSGRMAQIFDHSRMQSKTIADLKQQLKDTESASEKATEATPPSLGGSSDEATGLKVEVKRLQEQVNQYGHAVRSANFDKQRLSKNLESYRQQFERVAKEKSVMEESEQARSDLEQKNVALQAQVANLTESVSTAQNKATQLAAKLEGLDQELERLRRQNQELLGETEALRINLTTFEEDFKQEREDRQNAHGKMNEMEARHISEMDDVKKSLELTQRDLKHHKAHLRDTEQLLVSQKEQLQIELDSREAEISSLSEAKQSLEQDMMSKSQQVKQCRKQVELYEAELKGSREQMTAYKNQVEFYATKLYEDSQALEALKQEKEAWLHTDLGAGQGGFPSVELQAEVRRRQLSEDKVDYLLREVEQLREQNKVYQMMAGQQQQQPGLHSQPPPHAHSSAQAAARQQRPGGQQPATTSSAPPSSNRPPAQLPPPNSRQPPQLPSLGRLQKQQHFNQKKASSVDSTGFNQRGGGEAAGNVHRVQRSGTAQQLATFSSAPSSTVASRGLTGVVDQHRFHGTRSTLPSTSAFYANLAPAGAGIVSQANMPPHSAASSSSNPPPFTGHVHKPQAQSKREQSAILDYSNVQKGGQQPLVVLDEVQKPQYLNVEDRSRRRYVNIEELPAGNLSGPSSLNSRSSRSPEHHAPQTVDDTAIAMGLVRPDVIERDSPPSSFQPPSSNADLPQPLGQQFQVQQLHQPHIGDYQHYHTPGAGFQHAPSAGRLVTPPTVLPSQFHPPTNAHMAGSDNTAGYQQPMQQAGGIMVIPQQIKQGASFQPLSNAGGRHSTPESSGRKPVYPQAPSTQPPNVFTPPSAANAQAVAKMAVQQKGVRNTLESGIDSDISEIAKTVQSQVEGGGGGAGNAEGAPYDPNLICPSCGLQFRLGEIQAFKKHAASHSR